MNIPARYCPGYLSDIGTLPLFVPVLATLDFAAHGGEPR